MVEIELVPRELRKSQTKASRYLSAERESEEEEREKKRGEAEEYSGDYLNDTPHTYASFHR